MPRRAARPPLPSCLEGPTQGGGRTFERTVDLARRLLASGPVGTAGRPHPTQPSTLRAACSERSPVGDLRPNACFGRMPGAGGAGRGCLESRSCSRQPLRPAAPRPRPCRAAVSVPLQRGQLTSPGGWAAVGRVVCGPEVPVRPTDVGPNGRRSMAPAHGLTKAVGPQELRRERA